MQKTKTKTPKKGTKITILRQKPSKTTEKRIKKYLFFFIFFLEKDTIKEKKTILGQKKI